jgi:diacylglycerol kinase
MRFHLATLVAVIAAGWWLGLAPWEWAAVLLVSALVIGLEVVNSAVEHLADHLHPGEHPEVGLAKDMLAGAVLVATLCALLVAALVFLPKLWMMVA